MPRNSLRDAEIRRRWKAGETNAVILDAMKLTIGVVAGVIHRAAVAEGLRKAPPPRPSQVKARCPITGKQRRGFAAMAPEKRRAIAMKGGASVPADKRSFARDPSLAARAGAAGGAVSRGGGRKPAHA